MSGSGSTEARANISISEPSDSSAWSTTMLSLCSRKAVSDSTLDESAGWSGFSLSHSIEATDSELCSESLQREREREREREKEREKERERVDDDDDADGQVLPA